jgi:hypothetical protein
MVRLVSIDIPFENKEYKALLSIRNCGTDLFCQVRYVDKGFRYILAGDILVFNHSECVKKPDSLPNELAEKLKQCASKAISNNRVD